MTASANPPSSACLEPTLYDLVLPGTHDSAAYDTRPDLLSRGTVLPLHFRPIRTLCTSIQTDFALTQNLTILQQLRAGARFLDIRVSKRPHSSGDESFWTVHGMVLCVPLSHVIHQINEFHHENGLNKVTVVTVFRAYLLDESEHRALDAFTLSAFKHPVFDGHANELRTTPVRDLPHNLVAGLYSSILPVSWGQDAWLDTYSAYKKIPFLTKTLSATAHREMRDELFVLGWTVTPSVVDVTLRVLSLGFCRPAVKTEALKMNDRFAQFFQAYRDSIQERVNVVFFDCFDATHAVVVNSLNKHLDDPL